MLWWGAVPVFLILNLFAGTLSVKTRSLRLRICHHGGILLSLFAFSLAAALVFHIVLAIRLWESDRWTILWSLVFCVAAEAITFWNGIICVYCTSVQLGIRLRVIGALAGMIPVLNLIVLRRIIGTVLEEARFEAEKERIDTDRASERLCATKYPILFVHGVFFRDTKYFNYWGRIPKALETNGATVYYGEHASAASIENSAKELAARIETIVSETGCEKLNVIAHSKGGLDMRYAIAHLGIAEHVASLTTVNTPHRGCLFADQLLKDIPETVQVSVALAYNGALRKFGEENADFLAAVRDLRAEHCAPLDAELPVPEGIYCRSIGSRLSGATGGKFPLNFSYPLVKHYDGSNDGLVSENSFRYGEDYTLVTVSGKRGVSHGDMIDLNRENIPGFDVREFYVGLVSDLKKRGL
ncbi:MAG: triacylglycerol lipase [Clostridia bacterium]|nr:triacylglycerol lipase [Clostridia bacterium]